MGKTQDLETKLEEAEALLLRIIWYNDALGEFQRERLPDDIINDIKDFLKKE